MPFALGSLSSCDRVSFGLLVSGSLMSSEWTSGFPDVQFVQEVDWCWAQIGGTGIRGLDLKIQTPF